MVTAWGGASGPWTLTAATTYSTLSRDQKVGVQGCFLTKQVALSLTVRPLRNDLKGVTFGCLAEAWLIGLFGQIALQEKRPPLSVRQP